ncbi:hydantoinase B/oxoprolinase family protein [Amycolatopsis pithecellobii]|uniref:Hydantoinase B/oxoprolinase family protein n=1 Tax=Amycolatopsis pithecellobii TaxID=664692 RepID=A0A6N7YR21_9PSEU|nr:hydantoinase B/oxoprolinase family protein [Amycolatopsis pithecellobii]MTD55467.1 hydantoinase B/oxoprolinase family protein [Amycolatopsis pithecellobii]
MPVTPVPGSEKFAYRPTPAARLREIAGEHVRLHDVAEADLAVVDPLTYEVVRHRLESITHEMGEAIKRMSGSVIVTDCNDFNFVIMDEIGDEVEIGLYNTALCAAMDMAVKWTLENRAANPGIGPGDMFLCNDPWVGGGLHQNDTALFAPLFVGDELFAWTGAVAHQVDLGGVSPGSWSVKSTDVFWESLPTPPVKIVEGGVLRSDIEDVWLRRSRIPALVGLDLRAKIGANHMAQERLNELVERYGATTVKAVMRRILDNTERRVRDKLESIPDGEWSAVAYQDSAREGDETLYRIRLKLTKRGDRMHFDFTGTDPQADGLINCTHAGVRGGMTPVILTALCGDMAWAPAGVFRCIDITSEPGSINDCTFPAGISKGSVASAWATLNVVAECLGGMLDTREESRANVTGVCLGSWDLALLAGLDQRGAPFVSMVGDAMAGGFGARTDQDGVDTGGMAAAPMGRIPDVEMTEFSYPVLYLWRREEPDSGGPGRYRGGVGGSSCFVMHRSAAPALHLVVSGGGKAVPQSSGISGGYPANTQLDMAIRASDVRDRFAAGQMATSLDEIAGEREPMPPHLETYLGQDDAYYMAWQGGGGYGDPLHREPALVEADLRAGKVSAVAASAVYGVVTSDDGRLDVEGTLAKRQEIRDARLAAASPQPEGSRR